MPGPHRDSKGYYRILQVALDASEEEIQLAYERIEELSAAHGLSVATQQMGEADNLKQPKAGQPRWRGVN